MCNKCENILNTPTELNCEVLGTSSSTSLYMSYSFSNDKFWLTLFMSEIDNYDEYLTDENKIEIFYCPFCGEKLENLIINEKVVK